MEHLPSYYTILYNAVTDAVEALQHRNYGIALEKLLDGQTRAESAYIEAEDHAEEF